MPAFDGAGTDTRSEPARASRAAVRGWRERANEAAAAALGADRHEQHERQLDDAFARTAPTNRPFRPPPAERWTHKSKEWLPDASSGGQALQIAFYPAENRRETETSRFCWNLGLVDHPSTIATGANRRSRWPASDSGRRDFEPSTFSLGGLPNTEIKAQSGARADGVTRLHSDDRRLRLKGD